MQIQSLSDYRLCIEFDEFFLSSDVPKSWPFEPTSEWLTTFNRLPLTAMKFVSSEYRVGRIEILTVCTDLWTINRN